MSEKQNEKQNIGNTSTPYDDASRTMLSDCSSLIIPVVNEVFHKQHGVRETVRLFHNEFFFTLPDSDQKERVTDSNFAIGSVRYHLEFQSTSDGSIMWRVFEYDSQLALKDSEWSQEELTVRFPNTALIYLRHTGTTPDVMKKMKNHLLKKYSKLEEGLGVVMGGKILDYEAKDILNQGRAEGREEQRAETEKEHRRTKEADAVKIFC